MAASIITPHDEPLSWNVFISAGTFRTEKLCTNAVAAYPKRRNLLLSCFRDATAAPEHILIRVVQLQFPSCNQNYWAACSWLTDGLLVFVVEGMLWLWLFFCPFLSWSACWAIDLGKGKQTVRAIHFKYPERAHIWPTHFSMAWGKTTLNVS